MLYSSSRSNMISLSVAIAAITTVAAVYWLYKKFREPFYNPGMVSKDADDESSSNFDNPELYSKSTETTWMMPNGIELYHFPPSNKYKIKTKDNNNEPASPSPVLALHGGPAIAPTEPWKLCNEIPNMHLYHARGCGRSSRPFIKFPTPGRMWPGMKILEETLGIGAQVSDIERIRRRLNVEKIDLVGHSFGGFVATMYAAEFPEHVRSLTLLVPAAVLVLPAPANDEDGSSKTEDLFQIVQSKLEGIGNQKHIDDYKDFMKRYLDFGSLPNETEDTLAQRQNEFAVHYFRAAKEEPPKLDPAFTGGMACYATFLSMGIEHDYIPACKERLMETTFPVSIVHGGKDMVPVTTTRKYIQLFPKDNVEFYVVEDGDHSLFDHPKSIKIVNDTMERVK